MRPFFASNVLRELTTGRVKVFLKQELAISYSRAKHSKTPLSMGRSTGKHPGPTQVLIPHVTTTLVAAMATSEVL